MKTDTKLRPIIYQAFPRILTNANDTCKPSGTIDENGSGRLNDITPALLNSLRRLGITHLWLTGLVEHATKTDFSAFGIERDNPYIVKGEAGSPYAIKDYYDVATALAENVERRMEEFEKCRDRIHHHGLKLIIDFVPNHTARRYHSDNAPSGEQDFGASDDTSIAFSPSNNYYYIPDQCFAPHLSIGSGEDAYLECPAKATGNDCFSAICGENDWYETVKLNYGRDYMSGTNHFDPVPDTWVKMLHILRFWASKGVDGFRCDMVFMVPLEFWHYAIPQIKEQFPDIIFIGEIYDTWQYRSFIDYGCFDYLYDKVNLYDTLVAIKTRNNPATALTGCWQVVDGIGGKMLNFLENHDEVRFASSAFACTPVSVIPYLVTSAFFSTGPYMIYYGQELGERGEENEGFAGANHRSTIFDYWSYACLRRWNNGGKWDNGLLTPHEKWLRGIYGKVLRMCNSEPALREGGFFDLMYANLSNPSFNPHSTFSFLRHSAEQKLLVAVNFSDSDMTAGIRFPSAAFDAAGLPEGSVVLTDLLTGERCESELRRDADISLKIKAQNAVVLKIESEKSGKPAFGCQ